MWVRYVWLLALLLSMPLVSMAGGKKFTLVIDAGHGGNDAGAIGAVTKEKIINLNVAKAFGNYVKQHCPDVKVIYTRTEDVFVPLHTRADIANRNKADLFISIHTNSLPKGRVSRGLETYTLGMHRAADNLEVAKRENEVILYEKDYKQRYQGFDPNSSESYIMFEFMQDHNMAQSVELAKFVQRRTCAIAGRQDKGVKQAGFLVLRETSMPSCLIELGFISTADEERFLHSKSGVDRLARGIYEAFKDYKRKYDKNASAPQPIAEPQGRAKAESPRRAESQAKAEPLARADAQPKTEPESQPEPQLKTEPQPSPASDGVMAQHIDTSDTAPVTPPAVAPPLFKVQVLTSSTKLKASSPKLKGRSDHDYYLEGGTYKYTVGSSADYNAIYRLWKSLKSDFPGAFIIAFKEGQKVSVQQAIREFKENRNKL